MGEKVRGYKAFNPDWTCQDYQYSCPGVYEMDEDPKMCYIGFHFCQKITDCFKYYRFDPDTRIAEVEALGKIEFSSDDSKCCTNNLLIIRELPWEEVLSLSNVGENCYGFNNIGSNNDGNYNIGFFNVGDKNIGISNCGAYNVGHNNLGIRNTGSGNSGDSNAGGLNYGNWNTGDYNIGDYNTGDWNTASHCSGCFMTNQQPFYMFNKPTDMTYSDWENSNAHSIMSFLFRQPPVDRCIPAEVNGHLQDLKTLPGNLSHHSETTDICLVKIDPRKSVQEKWDKLENDEKQCILDLPNFDKYIFYECTGIKVD